jgi:sulfur transfer protein SufE
MLNYNFVKIVNNFNFISDKELRIALLLEASKSLPKVVYAKFGKIHN